MGFNALAGLAALKGFRESQQFQSDLAARKARNQYIVDTTPGLATLANARTDSELGDLGDKEDLRPLRQENSRIAAEGEGERGRLGLAQAKAATARFYAEHILVRTKAQRDAVVDGASSVTALALDAF